jgi:paraquat-inducible protein B
VSQKPHPRAVGAFVLGAVALVLAAIVLLSSGNWFEPKSLFTGFFPGSVRGLNEGAPVTFRGVRIGEVKDVKAFLTGQVSPPIQIEVVIEIRTNVVEVPEGVARPFVGADPETLARGLIERGVRARLLSQSLLTGQKYIDLDFQPGEPARLSGIKRRYPELPTTPTAMEKLGEEAEDFLEKLADLPLEKMLEDLRQALQSLREVLSSPDLKGTLAGTHRASRALEPAIGDARLAIADARKMLQNLDSQADGLGGDTRRTLGDTRAALESTRRALESLERTLAGADHMRVQTAETLEQLAQAMKAIRNLVEYIQTHPEAVLQGKQRGKEKP